MERSGSDHLSMSQTSPSTTIASDTEISKGSVRVARVVEYAVGGVVTTVVLLVAALDILEGPLLKFRILTLPFLAALSTSCSAIVLGACRERRLPPPLTYQFRREWIAAVALVVLMCIVIMIVGSLLAAPIEGF